MSNPAVGEQLPAAPPCAPWCTAHTSNTNGWTVEATETAKTCALDLDITQDLDGMPVHVTAEQSSWIEDGKVESSGLQVKLSVLGRLDAVAVLLLAKALGDLISIATVGVTAA